MRQVSSHLPGARSASHREARAHATEFAEGGSKPSACTFLHALSQRRGSAAVRGERGGCCSVAPLCTGGDHKRENSGRKSGCHGRARGVTSHTGYVARACGISSGSCHAARVETPEAVVSVCVCVFLLLDGNRARCGVYGARTVRVLSLLHGADLWATCETVAGESRL